MAKTTVLFVCPDNSLLDPMAEASLNARGGGLMRAFSAGIRPATHLNQYAARLLSEQGIDPDGLSPKPIDVFLMPHSVIPDRIIYLTEMRPIDQPTAWAGTTSGHWWSVAPDLPSADDFAKCSAYFQRILHAIDGLIDPSFHRELTYGNKVA